MSTLTVPFPDGRKPLELRDDSEDALPGNHHADINATKHIYGGPGGIGVYRAQGDFGDGCLTLAIGYKHSEIERLTYEWRISRKLKRVQGDAISPCYGLFRGKDPEAGGDVIVIAVAMLGKMLNDQGRLSSYPLVDRLKITKVVGLIHLEGMMPQFDLGGANVSRSANPEVFWLADFKDMQSHECPWDGNWHAGEDAPELEDFKCESLYEIGLNMGIWKPYLYPTTDVEGQGFLDMSPVESVPTVTHDQDDEP